MKEGSTAVSPMRNFGAGCAAGVSGCIVGHPFDTVKLVQQTSKDRSSLRSATTSLLKSGGPKALLSGLAPALAVQVLTSGFLFGAQASISILIPPNPMTLTLTLTRTLTQTLILILTSTCYKASVSNLVCRVFTLGGASNEEDKNLISSEYRLQQAMAVSSVATATVSGFLTGGLLAPIVCPLEAIKCRSQVNARSVSSSLFSGWSATVLRCSFGNAAFFGAYAITRSMDIHASIGGAIAGAAFWVAGMPFDVIKSRMQTTQKSIGLVATFQQAVRQGQGIRGLYAGLPVTLLRAVPMNAAVFLTYEAALEALE